MKLLHGWVASLFLFSVVAFATEACPDLSGQYQVSYTLFGEKYVVTSRVIQQACASLHIENTIVDSHGRTQLQTRDWIADGVFRRKDSSSVAYAIFNSEGLLTYEVKSPQSGSQPMGSQPYFSRRDRAFLDTQGNLVNAEDRYDEQGTHLGSSQFVYQRMGHRIGQRLSR